MAADDSCGPAIDFDNTGCLRISGASLFCSRHSHPFRLSFRSAVLPGTPFTPFFLQSVPVSFRPRPWRFASVCLLSFPAVPIRASNPLPALRTDAFRHPAKTPKATRKGPPLVERVDPQLLTPRQPRDASPPSRGCCPRVSSGPASVRRHSKPCGWPALR